MKKRAFSFILLASLLFNSISISAFAEPLERESISMEPIKDGEILEESEESHLSEQDNGVGSVQEVSLDSYQTPSEIMGEDVSLRQANMKYFINEDFSYTAAIYPQAVHYLDNGQWKDIDNGLIDASDRENYVQNKQNRFTVSFSEDTQEGQLVYINIDNYEVSWSIDTGHRAAKRMLVENVLDITKKELPKEDVCLPELETESDTEMQMETESDIEIQIETESDSKVDIQEETSVVSIEAIERETNKAALSDEFSETDISLVPEDNEPVGKNTEATLLTENPDAAKLAEKGDYAGIEKIEKNILSQDDIIGEDYSNIEKSIGVLPQNQESYKTTTEINEESLIPNYYSDIVLKNSQKMALPALESRTVYNNIDSGINLEYILSGEKLKENIILASPKSNKVFIYNVKLKDLTAELENNEILLKNHQGEVILIIQSPFMYDSKGIRSDLVTLGLEKNNNQWKITVSADQNWLNDVERVFPVVIDPVISTPLDYTQIKDARICSNYPTSNFVNDDILSTGYGNNTGDNRSFILFNLPKMDSSDIIVNAEMVLTCYSENNVQKQINVHKINETWDSKTITWNNKPGYSNAIADYTVIKDILGQRAIFDITDIVKEWYRGTNNYGVMVKDAKEEENTYTEYLSSDCSAANSAYRPQILITYINTNGIEKFWSYHSQDIGRAGIAYVNDYTGNLTSVHETTHTTGLIMPVRLTHVYNSNDKDKNLGYGNGFRLNYHQTIEPVKISGTQYYKYTDEDGTIHYFYYNNDKKEWVIDSGIGLTLVINTTDNEKYTIQDMYKQKYIFNSSGQLIKVIDDNGGIISIEYSSNKISKIIDGADRNTVLSYDSSGNLSKVESPRGTKRFAYADGNLVNITDVDNEIIKYEYNDNKLLTKIENIDGYNVNYSYTTYAPYRVATITEKAKNESGKSIKILYGGNWNWFDNSDGRSEEYSFNKAGNTTAIVTADGYAEAYRYVTEGEHKNSISKVSKLQYPIVQLLKNPGIESLTAWAEKIDGEAATSLNSDKSNAYIGNKSLKIISSSGKGFFSQKASISKGKEYTFSAYVKPDGELIKSKGSLIQLRYKDVSSKDTYVSSRELIPMGNGWYRMMCTAVIPKNAASAEVEVYVAVDKKGTAYFDCVQLESGKTANRYNLVENTDFRNGMIGYSLTGTSVFDQVVNLDNISESIQKETFHRGRVTTASLNVRSGAGTSYPVVTSVKLNQIVSIVEEKSDSAGTEWYYIVWSSGQRVYSGYASSAYIEKIADKTELQNAIINTSTLNVRAGAGTGYSVLTTVTRNTPVKILESIMSTDNQKWYYITFMKNSVRYSGCVLSKYVLTQDTVIGGSIDAPASHAGGELDNNVLMIYGNPGEIKRASQTLEISGQAGDAYSVNAWGIGQTVALRDNRSFGTEVTFNYADGTNDSFVTNFTDGTSDWLFIHDVVVAKKDYKSIKVSYIYGYNENVVYFDGLALYREDYSSSFKYDKDGKVISVEDDAKKSSHFEYDANNNINKIIDIKGNDFKYTYDSENNITSATSAANIKYTFINNGIGRPTEVKIVNPEDEKEYIRAKAEYDLSGNYMTATYDSFGHKTSYEYDVFSGLLKKVTDVNGTETHYTYNAFGKRTSVYTDFISANGNRLSSMCGFTYNDDYLVGVEYHGDTYRFSFDGFGKPLGVKVNEVPLVSYEYEKNNGNRTSISYASGQSYTYEYDSLNRITKICYKDASETSSELLYSYEYDKNGNLALSTDHIEDVIYYYYYDLSERLVKTADSRGNYEIYYYDDGNNVIKLESGDTSKTKIVEFTYDEDNRETGVKVNGKNYVSTYDKLGRISKRAWDTDTPLNISYEYVAGADGSQTALMSSYSNNNATISYTYDSKNNMTSISDKSGTSKYYYDEINQLYREDNHILNQTIVYNYDACGNILDKKIYDKTNEEKISGEPKQVITYTYADDWKDKLINYDGKDITYDASGNPLIFLDKQMTWFRDNRLKTIKNDTIDMSYTYDEDGYRIKKANHKTGSTTDYVISGSLILSEITKNKDGNVSENLEYIYDSYGNVIAFTYNNMPYYYMKNGQRDIVGIIDGTGKIIVTYTYDSWGNVISVDGDTVLGNSNPFRYRSYYYDKESNLYYLNSRYYSPEIGRFINADDTDALINNFDSALDGRNLFAYCNNNPITHWDTTGELIDTLFDVASLIIGIGEVIANPTDVTSWISVGADALCLIVPGITGGGTAVRAAKTLDKGEEVIEGFKAAYNVADKAHDVKKMSGSYTIHYASGHFYDGKGSVKRAVTSAKKSRSYKDKKTGMDQKDTVVGIEWSSAPNHKQAFIDEYDRMNHHGYGDSKKKNNMYNKIWSPGRKLTRTGLASERKFIVTCRRKLV